MVTKLELKKLGFSKWKDGLYYDIPTWDYMFDSATQELFLHSEVDGEVNWLCKIDNYHHLETVLNLTEY